MHGAPHPEALEAPLGGASDCAEPDGIAAARSDDFHKNVLGDLQTRRGGAVGARAGRVDGSATVPRKGISKNFEGLAAELGTL